MVRMIVITDQKGKLLGAVRKTTTEGVSTPLHFAKHPRAEQNYIEVEVPDDLHRRHPHEIHKILLEHVTRKMK
jgi:hypothetical protein